MAKASAKTKKTTSRKSTTPKKAQAPVMPPEPPKGFPSRSIGAVVFVFLFILAVVSYFNTDGTVILFFSNLIKGLIGWGFWLMAPVFLLVAAILGTNKDRPVGFRVFCAFMLPVFFSAILNLMLYRGERIDSFAFSDWINLFEMGQQLKCGGMISGLIAIVLKDAFSSYAAYPILILLFAFFLWKSLDFGFSKRVDRGEREEKLSVRAESPKETIAPVTVSEKRKSNKRQEPVYIPASDPKSFDIPLGSEKIDHSAVIEDDALFRKPVAATAKPATVRQKNSKRVPISVIDRDKGFAAEPEQTPEPAQPDIAAKPEVKIKKLGKEALEAETEKIREEIEKSDNVQDTVEYRYPPVDLLRSPLSSRSDAKDEILLNRTRLESALHSFGINANIVNIIHGPTVTRFDIELEQGVKLSRVTNLSGDLALSLGVINVRIAPIPDKISTVGIEVPNKIVNTVYLREIIESDAFTAAKSKLSFAIGKDIGGNCIVGNISKLPHMLIAGTTGSGKSVCMNSLILSLLYKAAPDEVKMIMIDPKMVELGIYNGIPHLYVPVVTDPKKAAGALQWSVVEMLKRYRLFSEAGVRDLATYNSRVTEENGKLPQVVIVIDELADLMIAASKEVEESICRVAQMGRAAGMHLIIATQRPSADVITGLMKANIPSRIAFAVSSAMESRIILDQSGAEKLVGMGDMLFSPVGSGKPVRIQGAFVSDEEREEVIRFVKEQAVPSEASAELKEFMEKAAEDKSSGDHGKSEPESARSGDYDELLPKAVEAVLEMKSCSVSMLQRRVKLGYSRAARIVDQMEELGIVGPYEGAKPRALTIDSARWQEMKIELGFASEDEIRNAEIISEQAEEDFADQ